MKLWAWKSDRPGGEILTALPPAQPLPVTAKLDPAGPEFGVIDTDGEHPGTGGGVEDAVTVNVPVREAQPLSAKVKV